VRGCVTPVRMSVCVTARGGLSQLQAQASGLPSLMASRWLHLGSSHKAANKWRYFPDRDLVPPVRARNTVQPPERYRLTSMPKVPGIWSQGINKPPKQAKEMWRMMGEERVHNQLVLQQYGIVALTGGMLKSSHFEVMRLAVGRRVKEKESFGLYRVDAPYKPITNHGQGKKMGGGKGAIDHYGTPIRAGRVILEVGGKLLWEEVQPWLSKIAAKLPFDAVAVNCEMLEKLNAEEARLWATNTNPVTFEWLVRNNIFNCQQYFSDYDKMWYGKFVYRDRELNRKWQIVTRTKFRGKS